MLNITNLNVTIAKTPILRGVSLSIEDNAMVGLIGRNGAGKTSLMRSIMGLLTPEQGSIVFEGNNLVAEKPHRRVFHSIGYLPEDRRLVPQFTVEENILVPLWATQDKDTQKLEWVYEIIPEIARFRDRQALTLSGGQQKLVALARAMVCGSKLLLLDEPFEGVAPALAKRLMDVLTHLKENKVSVLISESDYTHSKELVTDIYTIERGQVDKAK